jgi:hypothetical protein
VDDRTMMDDRNYEVTKNYLRRALSWTLRTTSMVGHWYHGLQRTGTRPVVKLLLEKGTELDSRNKHLWSAAAIVGCSEAAA